MAGLLQGASGDYATYATALLAGSAMYAQSVLTGPTAVDPLGRTVAINGTEYTQREIIEIASQAQAGDASAVPFLNEARQILREHGFRTGALGTEANVASIRDIDQRVALLRGDSNTEIAQLQRSASLALETDYTQLRERYGVFTEGRVTRMMADGTTRTIEIDFATDATRSAEAIGVDRREALAKTDWGAYQAVLNAGFSTPGAREVELSGAWRPEWSTFRDFFMQGNDARVAGLNAAQRELSLRDALRGAGFTRHANNPNLLRTTNWWSPAHTGGRGLDVVRLNDTRINISTGARQPAMVERFSRELVTAGATQVIQPWMTYGLFNAQTAGTRGSFGGDFYRNLGLREGATATERGHLDHLHLTMPR